MEHHEKVLALQMHMCEGFQLAVHVRVLRFYGGLGVKVLRVGLKLKEKDSTGLPRNVDCSRTRFHVDKLHLPAATWICFKG